LHIRSDYGCGSQLLVGPPITARFRARCRTNVDILTLQVGGWAWGCNPHFRETPKSRNPDNGEVMTRSAIEDEEEKVRKSEENYDGNNSVSFGHIFDILKTIKCKDNYYELLIGIQGSQLLFFVQILHLLRYSDTHI